MSLYDVVKNQTPWGLRLLSRQFKRRVQWAADLRRSPKQVFDRVYRQSRWGESGDAFFSGPGSDGPAAELYARRIREFIRQHNISSVVDLGCGDFRVARMFLHPEVQYLGVDVVDDLVDHNRVHHGSVQVRFECLDITADPLPDGELCLLREVLQHLSNAQIARVLEKLSKYRHVIYSDYQPAWSPAFRPNRDIVHGHDTRVWRDSCVCLDHPPFEMEVELLLDVPTTGQVRAPGERIRTYLVKQPVTSPVQSEAVS